MKRTQLTELLANIKATFVSFFSILMFVALGVGVFVGISWSGPALQVAADKVFDEHSMYNLQITYPFGLTQANLDELSQVEGVSKVEPTRQAFETIKRNGTDYTVKVQTVGKDLDKLIVIDGTLPTQPNEIAFKNSNAASYGYKIGDTITLTSQTEGLDYLRERDFIITALVESPEYIAWASATYGYSASSTGTVNMLAWVAPEAFNDVVYQGGYTTVNITCDELAGMGSFSNEYAAASKTLADRVSELGEKLAPARAEELRTTISEAIEKGEEFLRVYDLAVGDGALRDVKVKDVQKVLEAYDVDVSQYVDAYGLNLDDYDTVQELRDDGAALLASLKTLQSSVNDMGWTVGGRSYNGGWLEASVLTNVTNRLSLSMAALFIIVGLLVSYSAISRIVHEQVTQIGTKKALGLRAREITLSFLTYSALAVLTGAIIGITVGVVLVEGIIGGALGDRFIMGTYPPYIGIPLALGVTALELALVLGATWLACHSVLSEHAIELLRGEKPPVAKEHFFEKWGIWERAPLYTQTIVNNCLNDHRRVLSTIVGVAGCTALIVTAVTLNNDVLKSYDYQYDKVYGFNAIVYLDQSVPNAQDNVMDALEEQGMASAAVLRRTMAMTLPDETLSAGRLTVPENVDEFSSIYHLRDMNGAEVKLDDDGAWVTRAYAEHLGAKPGDDVILTGGDGSVHRIPIDGFLDFKLTYYEVVMSPAAYEKEFGAALRPNVIFANTGDLSVKETLNAIGSVPGFDSIVDDKIGQKGNFTAFSSVSNTVVLIYLALSALMAIVVLLNLFFMFIDEKKRELIVLMINGFSVGDAKRYIASDTVVLTAVGIILGVILGCVMGAFTVSSVEPDTASFVKSVDWIAVAAGVAGSAILALIMSVIALRRIPRFDLTDINRF